MKSTLLKTINLAAMTFMILAAFAQISVFAQEAGELKIEEQKQEDVLARRTNARRLEGSWNLQVTGRNCQTGDATRTFPSMFTFMRGGTMTEWGSGTAPSTRGLGHGVWNYESGRNYNSALQFFRFNADGTLAGRQILRNQIVLSHDGNSFTSSGVAQILDLSGNVIATNCSTAAGTRFE